jgi:WhiB family redox-sensing transcriptional regulator
LSLNVIDPYTLCDRTREGGHCVWALLRAATRLHIVGEVAVNDVSRLPTPHTEHWDWQLSAACRGIASDVFFNPHGERRLHRRQRQYAAKRICATCPVIQDCLKWALTVREPYGVWGGTTPEERTELLHGPAPAATRQS